MTSPSHLDFFTSNVDAWGAAEWFDRLAKAIREQDAAVLAKNDMAFETCKNIAASSAMRLVRDYEHEIRAALASPSAHPDRAKVVEALTLADRMENHVVSRLPAKAPVVENGAWQMMLDAAKIIRALAEGQKR